MVGTSSITTIPCRAVPCSDYDDDDDEFDDDDAVTVWNVRGNVRERGCGEETRGGYGTRKL